MKKKPARESLDDVVSVMNEAHARGAIRDLLRQYDTPKEIALRLAVELKLSVWLEEEYRAYIDNSVPVSKDWTS
jgi:plasmid replication initiation protein